MNDVLKQALLEAIELEKKNIAYWEKIDTEWAHWELLISLELLQRYQIEWSNEYGKENIQP